MASNAAKLGVVIDINDEQLTSLVEKIAGLQTSFASATGKIAEQADAAIKKQIESVKQQVGVITEGEKNIESVKAQSAARIEALETKITAAKEREAAKQKTIITRSAEEEAASAQKTASKIEEIENQVNSTKKKGLDAVRQKIYEQELETRNLRLKRAFEEDAQVKKEIQAQVNKVNTELQLYRSAEKEMTGGRTFTEQLEKNFKQAGGSVKTYIDALQTLEKKYKETDQAILHSNDETQKAILTRQKETVEKEIAETKKLITAEQEEHKKADHGGGGMHGMLAGVVGGGVAASVMVGLEKLQEHYKEAAESQKMLQAGTGLVGEALQKAGEEAEGIGKKFAISGENAKIAMGKVSSYTGATGEELKKQTEAVVAYGIAHGKSESMVAKMLATEKGREKIMSEANLNIAKAQEAATTPAANLARIQNTLMETFGKVAMVAMGALGPALTAVTPLLDLIGNMVETVLKPALAALDPVMKIIAQQFTNLAPIIVDLITTGLDILTPIISDLADIMGALIPPMIQVVKTILDSLKPVFKQLTPIITEVAQIITEVFIANSDMMIDMLQNVLVPLIRDLVAPILLSLMPVIKMVADLMQQILVPAVKVLSGIMKFLMENIIQPLIKWLSGGLVTAINAVVGVVKGAIEVISKVTNALGSLLGLGGDEAVAKTKQTGANLLEADKQNTELAKAQKEKQSQDEINALKAKQQLHLKIGKLTADEESDMREQAQEEGNEKILAQLDAYDKKKANQAASAGKKAAAADKQATKDAYTELKIQKDEQLEADLIFLQEKFLKRTITEKQFHDEQRNITIKHTEELLQAAHDAREKEMAKGHKANKDLLTKYNAEIRALTKKSTDEKIADRTKDDNEELEKLKLLYENKKDIAEDNAAIANATEKEHKKAQYDIQVESYQAQIALLKKQGADTEKLQLEFDKFQHTHSMETIKEAQAQSKEIIKLSEETEKAKIDVMKDGAKKDKAQLELSLKEENDKQALELRDVGSNEALKDQIIAYHEQKRYDITKKYHDKEKADRMESISFITGPFVKAFQDASGQLEQKFFDKMYKGWAGANTVAGQVLRGITDGIIKFVENYIIQKGLALAADVLFGTTQAATMAAIAAAAAPAATMVSIASFGAADVAATAGITSTAAVAQALTFAADGGYMPLDKGEKGKDSIFAVLMPGEGVLTTDEIEKLGGEGGFNQLRQIIRGSSGGGVGSIISSILRGVIPQFLADGGMPKENLKNAITFTASTGAHRVYTGNIDRSSSVSSDVGALLIGHLQEMIGRFDVINETFKKRPNPQILSSHNVRLDIEQNAFVDSQRHFSN